MQQDFPPKNNPRSIPAKPTDNYRLQVIAQAKSSLQGMLLVTKNPILGTNIITLNKTVQSGDQMEKVWKGTLTKIKKLKPLVKSCLILGYGGGSAAFLVHKLWPKCQVMGVDIDPVLIELGKKYLTPTDNYDEVIIGDAFSFEPKRKYDLILVDLFIENRVPEAMLSRSYLENLIQHLLQNGVLCVNYLNLPTIKTELKQLKSSLMEIFDNLTTTSYRNNRLLVCFKEYIT